MVFLHKVTVSVLVIIIYFTRIEGSAPGEVSKQMCKKYAGYVKNSYKCHFSDSDQAVGNSFATREEFPHMVLIGHKKNEQSQNIEWLCAGSLISEDFVLTAAHCIQNTMPNVAKIGIVDASSRENLQEIRIEKVIPHPEYDSSLKYNDIALIKLEKKVDINKFVRPACLFTDKVVREKIAINSGWGPTEFLGEFNDNLQKIVLEIYDEQKCAHTYGTSKRIKPITYDTKICAGTKSVVTIQARTGGPLLIPHKDEGEDFKCMYDIIGVASFGKAGGIATDIPDVYSRVSSYVPWIETIVWK